MRGVTPNGVTLPRGAISVIEPPGAMSSLAARRAPMITLSPPLNMASASGVSELETAVRSLRSPARMPRTTTPGEVPPPEASAWPSMIGATWTTPGTARTRAATASKLVRLPP